MQISQFFQKLYKYNNERGGYILLDPVKSFYFVREIKRPYGHLTGCSNFKKILFIIIQKF
ncbi:MAG: hypothetical protein A3C07_03775 [Candidatus Sungbacteria bacterium RIFCSPHIGHO2_02_FULL_47_11]|uniref:Uncharacterized protein n=1 Tax=Candidatus Sungbacteria bacterium RIFCSPHIGHO2_02_FULL_47_11 TaxID=1802270 RepID=A0A1G2KQP0_9BACT|nr:MAG: hypothetical protein A3C07_03775 [Candidatus Sungbacteria bacterium RIFCSPHIGHO2_02_FULL_47_11]